MPCISGLQKSLADVQRTNWWDPLSSRTEVTAGHRYELKASVHSEDAETGSIILIQGAYPLFF